MEIMKAKKKISKTFSSLKHKNFRYFWLGQCVSLMGTWMQRTAQTWLVYTITKSAFLLSLLGVCQFAPMMIFSLFAGVIVDRFSKKKMLIFTQVVFMLQALILTLLVWTGYVRYWHILILSALFGLIQTLDMPARQSFFIDMVGKEDIMNAISLNSTIVNLARIVGPLLAGVTMAVKGPAFCFFINTLSFLAVIYGLTKIKIKESYKKKQINAISEIKDGLHYIRNNENLLITFILMAIVCTFAMNLDVIIPVFAKEVLNQGAGFYTVLLAAAGSGSLAGALIMASRSRKGLKRSVLIWDSILVSLFEIILLFEKNYLICILTIAAIGFCNLTFLNMSNSFLQLGSSDEYRVRVMSVYSLINLGSTPIGNFYAGTVMQYMKGKMGFPMCGLITIILVLIVLVFKNKIVKIRHQN